MATAKNTPKVSALPQDVQFTWDASDRHIKLEYIGLAARLIECGAIEPHMAEKAARGAPKPRRDSAGHRFHRETKIVREPVLATALRITRYISDTKFAETLPGAPRGLRMKRLDWLDAHPDRVHVATRKWGGTNGYRAWTETHTAGTAENLIAAGFPKSCFCSKKLARSGSRLSVVLTGGTHGYVRALMRGYFEVEIRLYDDDALPMEEEAQIPAVPQSHLRLVVDNSQGMDHG